MNTQPSNNETSNQPSASPTNPSPREQRRAERAQRRAERYGSNGAWVGGAILILIGILLLMQNMGIGSAGNWWALFILLPAVGSFGAAWNEYQNDGQMSSRMLGSLVAGVFFTGLAVALYFGINLNWIGPLALILAGLGMLAAVFIRPTSK